MPRNRLSFCASNPAQWDTRFLGKPFHTLYPGMEWWKEKPLANVRILALSLFTTFIAVIPELERLLKWQIVVLLTRLRATGPLPSSVPVAWALPRTRA